MGEGVLSREDQALLSRSWGPVREPQEFRVTPDDWSIEDVALLDELRYELGDVPEKPRGDRDDDNDPLAHLFDDEVPELTTFVDRDQPKQNPRTTVRVEDDGYAHVLVDEAQDLTPMQWRMVGRRGRAATWTVVGDPAQSSWPVPDEATTARGGGARRQGPARVPPVDELPQQQGDLRLRGPVRLFSKLVDIE